MSNNPLLNAISAETGLAPKQLNPDNPLISAVQRESNTYLTPGEDRTYGFDGLDTAAGTIRLTNKYTDPLESYTSYGVARNAFIDWNDTRAENQGTLQKWAHGLTKAGITTLGAVTENTIGVAGGLLNLAFGENHSYYDNPVGRTIDEVNQWAQQAMPNYYSQREEKMGIVEALGSANFWADKFANGVGYTLGSMATMLTGVGEGAVAAKVLGSLGRMGKIAKAADAAMDTANAAKFGSKQFQAYNAAKAVNAPYAANFAKGIDDGLAAMAKRANINTAAKQLSVGMHMSLAEASVEAREAKNRFIEEQTAKWEEENPGQEMTADIEDGIIASATAVGNMTFGVNLPLLTLTNMVSFSKMFTGGKPAAEALTYNVKKVGTQWVEAIPEKGMARAFAKSSRIFGVPVKNALSEGAQEAGQFITASTAGDYYSDKFADGVGDMSEAFVNGLSKSIGTKEGLESILIGALVGGGSGTISRLFGADKKFAKAKDANTKKTLEILNSEAFGKVMENMEQSQRNLGLVDDMTKATQAGEFKKAEIFRRKLISSIADQYRKSGALDYAMQQMDDLKQLNEEEFKKRWGYDANRTLKEQTGMDQSEIIEDVKSKMERSVKRQEQVQAIVRAQNPSMGMFSRILNSFESEELKKSKALENSIRNMYANTLLYRLENVDSHDDLIKQSYKELQDLAPAISAIPEEDFEFMVKTGKIAIDEKGDVTISDEINTTLNPKLLDKLNEIFKAKKALNPEDGEQFKNKLGELRSLVTARQAAVQSYQGLRNKPEDIALLVEAEVEKRKQDDKYKNKQQAQAAVANAQSVEELDKAFPKNADAEDIAAAMAKREELIEQEEAIMPTYEAMSKDEFDAIDSESLPPLEESAYNRVKRKKEDAEAERRASKNIGVTTPEETAAEATISYEEVLSDIEARTFGEIMVSFDGNSVTIDGRSYSNLEDNPLDALLRDEFGTIVGVKMTDMATGNEVTWKSVDIADSSNPELTERENAIAEGLAYMTLLKAASIRSDQSVPLSEAREELSPRVQAIKEDAEVREKFEENAESTEDERELAKNNLSKTAGLTDDQLRAQIETLKSDLEELNEVLTIEEQIAREAGFTKKEFDQDPQTKELRAIKKRITQLIRTKIKALRDRKQTTREEALGTDNTAAEVENALSPSEEDLIKAGIEEELRKLEDEKAPLLKSLKTSEDILNGKYDAAEDPEAAKETRRSTIRQTIKQLKKKIDVIDSKINKRKNLINKLNEERELEKLREDRDSAERAGIAPEGQEPEGKDITPREGTPQEGLDGILSEDKVKELRQQREEAERLRKLEEEKKKAQTPTPQLIVTPQPVTVTTSGQLDVRLVKGEKTIVNNKILVSEEGESLPADMVQQTVSGVPIIVNPALASNPIIAQEGTEVRFEVREDTDWWLSQTPTAGEEWKTVPIYMVVKDQDGVEQRVALLQSTTETSGQMRKDIYELYKKGLTPVAMSAGKVYDSTNYSNATLADGTKFFYPASTLVNKGETPAIVIVGIKDFQKNFKVATTGDTNFPNLIDTALSFDTLNLTLGQVGVVVMDPNGAPRVVIASTRDMTEAGRTAALAMIEAEEPSLNQFAQIVGTNLLLNDSVDPAAGEQVYTEINEEMAREYSENAKSFMLVETLANGTELITFFSPSANSLVRMNAANMKVALAGAIPVFSFVEVGTNQKGHTALVTVKKDGAVRTGMESKLADEFKAAIMTKKFQVDKNMLSSKEAYTSPISGQVYDSYFQYLTSENEVPEERTEGKGTKAILGVDTEVNSQKSPFFDVGIKTTNLGTKEGDVTTERELAAKQVVMPTDNTPTGYPITERPTLNIQDWKIGDDITITVDSSRRTSEYNTKILDIWTNNGVFYTIEYKDPSGNIEQINVDEYGVFEERNDKEYGIFRSVSLTSKENAPETPAAPVSAKKADKPVINIYWGSPESSTNTKELSNLAPRKFTYQGKEYGSVEHAYQTLKSGSFDEVTYDKYVKAGGYGTKIRGKAVQQGFDNLQLMKDLVVESFKQNPDKAQLLLKYSDFTHTTNEVIDKAFLDGVRLAQKNAELAALGSSTVSDIEAERATLEKRYKNEMSFFTNDVKNDNDGKGDYVEFSFGRKYKDEITNNYRAELAALEAPVPVSDKKADIERRRQNSLKPNKAYEEGYTGNRFWEYTSPTGARQEMMSSTENLIKDINTKYDAELAALGQPTADVITDDVYNTFVDKNNVPDNILNSIADKVINRAPLSQRETAIFSGKTSEINEIIRKKAAKPAPAAPSEEKVVEITGAEDTSGIFDLFGTPVTPKASAPDVKPAPVSIWPSEEEIKAAGLGNPYDSLGIEPENVGSVETFATMALRNQQQAKQDEENCIGNSPKPS